MLIDGRLFIAGQRRGGSPGFRALDVSTLEELEETFTSANAQDVETACAAAAAAQSDYASRPLAERASFLRLVATKIDALGDTLTQRAMRESGLPEARLNGERGRTVGQLRLFADEVENGAWQGVRIDHADAERTPPKPDLRLRMIPLGPVAVFGASNFPLAFSVAGGDTASALAAGCCVVVKGHPAHPGTSELVATAITEAVAEAGMPAGVFSLLNGTDNALGEMLVKDPHITAVGFTGSRGGGLALMQHAADRPVPIPVYAEMSSINPVVLLPNKLAEAAEDLGRGYVGSLTLGAGQFCTNPGVVIALADEALDRFLAEAATAMEDVAAQTMLTPAIGETFEKCASKMASHSDVEVLQSGKTAEKKSGQAHLFVVSADRFISDDDLAEEMFGPSSLVVKCTDTAQIAKVLEAMEGQLTASVHMNEADYPAARELMSVLEQRAGRIIANGWPTGVDVAHAMVHGGPFPATSDGRSTSVGSLAIDRFLRPVSYQDMPAELLPEILGDDQTGGLRRIDGEYRV